MQKQSQQQTRRNRRRPLAYEKSVQLLARVLWRLLRVSVNIRTKILTHAPHGVGVRARRRGTPVERRVETDELHMRRRTRRRIAGYRRQRHKRHSRSRGSRCTAGSSAARMQLRRSGQCHWLLRQRPIYLVRVEPYRFTLARFMWRASWSVLSSISI